MSMWDLATGPGWLRRFGLTWLSSAVLVAAGLTNLVQAAMTVQARSAASEATPDRPNRVIPVARVGGPLTVDLLHAHDGSPVEVRVIGCSDAPIALVREGEGFPLKLWDLKPDADCSVQARRKDGQLWTRWTAPVHVASDADVAVVLPRALAGGVGVRISGTGDGAYVHEVVPWTPAWLAGLERGDVVETVDGRAIGGASTDQMVEWITGAAGSSVDLGVLDVRTGRRVSRRVERRFFE